MAIAFKATGSIVFTLDNLPVTIPAGTVEGDLMVIFYGTKPYNDNPIINQGWNNGGFATDGTIAAGNDAGSMQARIFWKIHTATETGPTITNATNNISGGVIHTYSKDPLKFWNLSFGGGGDNTAGTAFSAVTPSLNLDTNDFVASFIAIRSDAGAPGFASYLLAASGITFSAFTSQPAASAITASGGDMSMRTGYSSITAGTATTPITITNTLGGAHTGSMYLVRMREADTPQEFSTSFDPMGMMGFFGM